MGTSGPPDSSVNIAPYQTTNYALISIHDSLSCHFNLLVVSVLLDALPSQYVYSSYLLQWPFPNFSTEIPLEVSVSAGQDRGQ